MKHYTRTLLAGILGLIGGSIGYIKEIPVIVQLSITALAVSGITMIAFYDRKKQLENDEKILIDRMRTHLNLDYHTNQSGSDYEKAMEAQRLNWFFKDEDEATKHKAIAKVLKVTMEEVKELLNKKIDEQLVKTDAFSITNR